MAVVLVDHRERPGKLCPELERRSLELSFAQLPLGDYALAGHLIERKTAADFLSSVRDGRLWRQLKRLWAHPGARLFILEGDPFERLGGFSPNAIRGAILSIVLYWEIPLIWTRSAPDTAEFFAVLARRDYAGSRKKNPQSSPWQQRRSAQMKVLTSLPGIGPVTAWKLLKRFGSLKAVFEASPEELAGVEGMGSLKADLLLKLFL